MKRLALCAATLLACGDHEGACDEIDTEVYQVPIALTVSPEQRSFAEVESCYLPSGGPSLCAQGRLFDWALSFMDSTRDGVLVTLTPIDRPTLTLTWRWTHETWLEDGDRYSVKVTSQDGQVLLDRTEAVTYGSFDVASKKRRETDSRCVEPVVARLEF